MDSAKTPSFFHAKMIGSALNICSQKNIVLTMSSRLIARNVNIPTRKLLRYSQEQQTAIFASRLIVNHHMTLSALHHKNFIFRIRIHGLKHAHLKLATIYYGFQAPKNWDGKKVNSPNGRAYGWPDKKGNIWIPTGPKGHGAPHWDVQLAKGGYKNILPGGRERGQK